MVSLQNPGQPMGWLGWPVATALPTVNPIPGEGGSICPTAS